jgi:hypothetical protein
MRTNPTACCPGKSSVPWFTGVVSLVVGLMTMSCASFGPNKLQSSHLNYNKAVQQAQMDEDLLNIVRLRYLDMPVSLSVSSISAQASFTVGTGGEFGLVEGESSANITPGISYTDRPTITFTPLQGSDFLDSLAKPITLEVLVKLADSQAGIDVLLRVAVANLNGIRNRFDSASPDFNRLAARFKALETQNDIAAGFLERTVTLSEPIPADSVDADSVLEAARDNRRFEPDHDGRYRLVGTRSVPFLWIDPSTTTAQELLDQLRLTKDATSFEMKSANRIEPPVRASDFLAVRSRSLLLASLYLSHGVDVPEAHERAGIARPEETAGPDLSDLFRVRVSETKPREPGITVEYRDHWFFILDSDHSSKRTFGLLQALFLSQLTKGTAQGAPVLTLPLN